MNKRLKNLLSDVFGVRSSEIHEYLLRDDIQSWDSLKQMDLVLSIEREYEVDLALSDILRMDSVANIVAVLTEKGVDLAD
jgi:acyl carrier protein